MSCCFRTQKLAVRVQLSLEWNSCELGIENQRGGIQKALLLIFVILEWCFDCQWIRVGGVGQKVSFAFSVLVLLKKMSTRRQSKTSSCYFGVNQDNLHAG